jgi:hypothetical protein
VNGLAFMSNDGSPPPPAVDVNAPCCRSLRSNGMYVFADGRRPDASDDDDDGGTAFWCSHTMKSFGPDDSMVGRRQCRNPSRSCYEPI